MTVTREHAAVTSGRAAAYLYVCLLTEFLNKPVVTSETIARVLAMNATQVRRDLSELFGRMGKRGTGYAPSVLAQRLRELLGTDAGSGAVLLIAAQRKTLRLDWALPGTLDVPRVEAIRLLTAEAAGLALKIDQLLAQA